MVSSRRTGNTCNHSTRAEASRLMLSKRNLDLRVFLSNIVERYRKIFDEKGVGLDLLCDEGARINADPDRLSQIVINLLSNALKATDKGGIVSLSILQKVKAVTIEV